MKKNKNLQSWKLREIFLNFFEKKGHKKVPSSSLLTSDPSVLFTTAGMQQFKYYYLGKSSPYGQNVCSCQKCFRTSDIEEIGDERHLTFLEMLGNFSFGGYFKKEAINFAYDFLFEELKLSPKDFSFTVFEGDKKVPEDKESVTIWKELGVPKEKIKKTGREDNFWGPTGKEGPCGPTTEIYYKNLELWNLVFNEYYQDEKGNLTLLKQKGVDTGMGLERLTMVCQKKRNVFETDLFLPLINELNSQFQVKNSKSQFIFQNLEKAKRIIADHVKGSVFLIAEGILPSNVERGYVLRRILRRAVRYGKLLNLEKNFLIPLAKKVIEIYKKIYPEIKSKENDILTIIQLEEEKFEKTLILGLKTLQSQIKKFKNQGLKTLSGKFIFDLYQSYGFPLELTKEIVQEEGFFLDEEDFKKEFQKHQAISRAGAEKKFGGIGKDPTYDMMKLHTATHLLHAALRKILGSHIKQEGSDINSQRLRFDFSHPKKLSAKEIERIEELVNQKIKEKIPVKKEKMEYKEAIKKGVLAFFQEKYPEIVTVYSIGDFSREICAGPHVKNTEELGVFKIIKEESLAFGKRRIKAVLK